MAGAKRTDTAREAEDNRVDSVEMGRIEAIRSDKLSDKVNSRAIRECARFGRSNQRVAAKDQVGD